MNAPRRLAATFGLVAVTGIAAVAYPYVSARVKERQRAGVPSELRVTSPADSGPGTLRAALFAALRAGPPGDVVLLTGRIRLHSPLPPLVAARGLSIRGSGTQVIDASALESGAVLDLRSPGITLEGIRISGARDRALQVRADRVTLRALAIAESDVAIQVTSAADLQIVDSDFTGNRIGVAVGDARVSGRISGNRFSDHREAGIWAVNGAPPDSREVALTITANGFRNDRHGIVTGNIPVRITANRIDAPHAAGLLLLGRYAEASNNRVHGGAAMGIVALEASDALVADNEIDDHAAVGILVRAGRNLNVRGNRVYNNAYGIAAVLCATGGGTALTANVVLANRLDGIIAIGDGSVIQHNRLLGNTGAGLRVLDLVNLDRSVVAANPLLSSNVFEDNGADAPVRGRYLIGE